MARQKKTKACKKFLQLMDSVPNPSYEKFLKQVLKEDKRLSKKKLESELNLYI
tara:strand:- start:5071 stop:5229 length:159 start_codon:yes stop_codon:yes gene_type:complete